MTSESLRVWKGRTPVFPLHYLLREEGAENWVRFYSLPDGKRYCETQREKEELNRRHRQISSKVLGVGQPCEILLCNYDELVPDGIEWTPCDVSKIWTIDKETEERLEEATFYSSSMLWNPIEFEKRLALVAEDMSGPVSVLSTATGGIYCPYDGGMDVFPVSLDACERLRTEFKEWTSPLESGL